MNRKARRDMERKGKQPKAEPSFVIKPSEMVKAAIKGPGKAAMDHEIHQQLLEKDKVFCKDVDTMVLWTLHSVYGWGPKRLKDFYICMFREHLRMRDYYEMDELYPERYKLKEKGVDLDEWFDKLFDDEGNFKDPDEVVL